MRRLVMSAAILTLVLWPGAAFAQPKEPPAPAEQVVLSGDVVVPKGRVAGQVVVFSGSATVAGVVDGDVVVLDGPIVIQGQVSGDVVAIDGSVRLAATAQVGGSVLAGEDVDVVAGAQVGGDTREGVRFSLGRPLSALGILLPPLAIALSVLLAGLLVLVVAPRAGERAAGALATAPFGSVGWGIGLAIFVPLLGLVATASILALPFGLALLLGAGLLWLAGEAALVWGIGRLLVRPPRARAGAVLAGWAIVAAVGLVPVLNVVWWVLGSAVGLGTVAVATWRAGRGRDDGEPRGARTREKGGRHAAGRTAAPVPTPPGESWDAAAS